MCVGDLPTYPDPPNGGERVGLGGKYTEPCVTSSCLRRRVAMRRARTIVAALAAITGIVWQALEDTKICRLGPGAFLHPALQTLLDFMHSHEPLFPGAREAGTPRTLLACL